MQTYLARLLPALAAVLALSCDRSGTEVPGAWQIVDLWREGAKLNQVSQGDAPPSRTSLITVRGRRVTAVQHRAGDQLSWRVELGSEPSFSFRPNAVGGRCDFEVLVREPGRRLRPVYQGSHEPRDVSAPEERGDTLDERIDVDLAAFAGESIELVLAVAQDSENCELAQWASPIVTSRGTVRRKPDSERPNIILITADTLRTDALGAWGRTPSVTPNLDRLAGRSDVWLRTFASCNSTNPSFASLMTGLYVKSHGVFNLKTPLPESHETLAELLQDAGYDTSAVVSVRHLAENSGLRQGFDRFRGPAGQYFAETAVNLALHQLQELDEPFFHWLHLFDPHTPQNPPAPFDTGYRPSGTEDLGPVDEWLPFREPGPRPYDPDRSEPKLLGHADLYPGEVSYLDWQVGRLLAFLESRDQLEDSLLIFVADHGENLGEHGIYFNHVGLFDLTVQVPLIIKWPGQQEGREHEMLVQHFDIFPTLLSFLGLEPPPNDGIDLQQAAQRGRGRRAVFANHANDHGEMVRTETHKYYFNRAPYRALGVEPPAPLLHPRGAYLFDLTADPQELNNLAGKGRPQERSMAEILERWLATGRGETPPALEISAEERERLEALGYVE